MSTETETPRLSIGYRILFPVAYALAWCLMMILGPYKTIGRYRVPKKGGLLILSNHRSDIDPIVVQMGAPRYVRFMAKSELFNIPILGSVMRFLNAFPVKRGAPDRTSIKQAVSLLKAGEAVGIFPEGQLTETGNLQEILPGAALIVRMAGVPVICCGLKNTELVMPYGKFIPRPAFRWVTATWGEVRQFESDATGDAIVEWIDAELRSLTGDYERPQVYN